MGRYISSQGLRINGVAPPATRLGRDVAIKVLPPALARDRDRRVRFEREAKLLAALNHPNIAAIYGVETVDGVDALILECVEGPTLADKLERGPMPLPDALRIATQMAQAIEAAHESGIVHRDLKPANVKIRADGTFKVLDFGLAKAASGEMAAPNATQSPTVVTGTTREGMLLGTAA